MKLELELPKVKNIQLKRQTEPYTKADIEKLLEVGNQRDRLIVLLATTMGIRIGELGGLTVKDFDEVFNRKEGVNLV